MTMEQFFVDASAVLILFLLGALGYACAWWCKQRVSSLHGDKKLASCWADTDFVETQTTLATPSVSSATSHVEKRPDVRKRAKRHTKGQKCTVPALQPQDDASVPISAEVATDVEYMGASPPTTCEVAQPSQSVAQVSSHAVVESCVGGDLEEDSSFSFTPARADRISAKKASRKARKLQTSGAAVFEASPDQLVLKINAGCEAPSAGESSKSERSTPFVSAPDLSIPTVEAPVHGHNGISTLDSGRSAQPLKDGLNLIVEAVIPRCNEKVCGESQQRDNSFAKADLVSEDSKTPTLHDQSAHEQDDAVPYRCVWSTVEDDVMEGTQVCAELTSRIEDYKQTLREKAAGESEDASTFADDDQNDADEWAPRAWNGHSGGIDDKSWWEPNRDSSWNEESPFKDDWMTPFDEILSPSTDTWDPSCGTNADMTEVGTELRHTGFGGDNVASPQQPFMGTDCMPGFYGDYTPFPQMQPCVPTDVQHPLYTDVQQPLYTDGDIVYMLACVEVPTPPTESALGMHNFANPTTANTAHAHTDANAILGALEEFTDDGSESAGSHFEYLTDDEFGA